MKFDMDTFILGLISFSIAVILLLTVFSEKKEETVSAVPTIELSPNTHSEDKTPGEMMGR